MNAPLPVLTSSTRPSIPSASFFDMIEAAIKRDRLDGRRRVAERVEQLVGRGDLGGLADQDQAALVEHRLVAVEVEVDAEAGDRLELVERAAGVAQPAARDHRHRHARRRGDRRQDQRGLVADAAGAVLVDLQARRSPTGRRPTPSASSRRSGRRSRPRPSRARRSPSGAPTTGNRRPRRVAIPVDHPGDLARRRGRCPSRFLRMMSTARMTSRPSLRESTPAGFSSDGGPELAVAGVAQAGIDEADLVQAGRRSRRRGSGRRASPRSSARSPRARRSARGA